MAKQPCQMTNYPCQTGNYSCQRTNYSRQIANDWCQMTNYWCQMTKQSRQMTNDRCQNGNYPCQMTNETCQKPARRRLFSVNSGNPHVPTPVWIHDRLRHSVAGCRQVFEGAVVQPESARHTGPQSGRDKGITTQRVVTRGETAQKPPALSSAARERANKGSASNLILICSPVSWFFATNESRRLGRGIIPSCATNPSPTSQNKNRP